MGEDDRVIRTLYLDVFAGISGDMMLGALLDLGVPSEPLLAVVEALGLADEVRLEIGRTSRHQIAATRCQVVLATAASVPTSAASHTHPDDHGHLREEQPPVDDAAGGHHASPHERPYSAIVDLLDRANLAPGVRRRAQHAFKLLAEAESLVHGVAIEDVAFHEVGAVDSLVDIVGAAALVEALAPDRIVCSPMPLARAIGRSAHGAIPIPAPATAYLLRGVPVVGQNGPDQSERVTPTGAALAVSLADSFGPIPSGRLVSVGYGAGRKDFRSVPNLLRLLVLETT